MGEARRPRLEGEVGVAAHPADAELPSAALHLEPLRPVDGEVAVRDDGADRTECAMSRADPYFTSTSATDASGTSTTTSIESPDRRDSSGTDPSPRPSAQSAPPGRLRRPSRRRRGEDCWAGRTPRCHPASSARTSARPIWMSTRTSPRPVTAKSGHRTHPEKVEPRLSRTTGRGSSAAPTARTSQAFSETPSLAAAASARLFSESGHRRVVRAVVPSSGSSPP